MLPEGKKPFVMSQDDVCYYPYMDGDGFAKRIVIGENGKPACEMVMDDGTTSTGSYDLIPLLEDFIQEHPDFSYKGARAIIAFTGYEGILGYRTASSYQDSPTYEADRGNTDLNNGGKVSWYRRSACAKEAGTASIHSGGIKGPGGTAPALLCGSGCDWWRQ